MWQKNLILNVLFGLPAKTRDCVVLIMIAMLLLLNTVVAKKNAHILRILIIMSVIMLNLIRKITV